MNDRKVFLSVIALLIVHVAGIIGLHSTYSDLFRIATPFNLVLCVILLFVNHQEFNRNFMVFCTAVLLSGFFIEAAGVSTGKIFGHYQYGSTLGWQIFHVPVMIGFNWLMLIYCAGVISNKLKAHILIRCCAGALLLVALDLLLEKCAPLYDLWAFPDGDVPLKNYIAWFLISFVFLFLFHSLNFKKENRLAPVLYIVQLLFFALLYLL